ncbi:MAG: IS1634 family transposase [Candidatus Neomarinimicrobiota bacterium]|nr:MAG: IS1634 family transposase [Candidatus Neomarinimicrobiota bacterium]
MFIRRTVSKNKKYNDEKYYTYRLVESYRLDGKVKQRVLLNLGADFTIDKERWSLLSTRIEDIVKKRNSLFECDKEIESLAQQYALQIISLSAKNIDDAEEEYKSIDVNSIEHIDPKTVGTEYIVYETIKELELPVLFESLGFTPIQIESALGVLIAKACAPASDKKSIEWLREKSGAGELVGCDYNSISGNSIYRVADTLLSHKEAIERHLYDKTKAIFEYDETITLYDLTNTYFEGEAKHIEKAARGRSKEKRSDAKIVTLAVVLDSSGFVKNSKIFKGNISEPSTLQEMIDDLKKTPENQTQKKERAKEKTLPLNKESSRSLVVMDAGIASQKNIDYLKESGWEYLVVSRKREKQFDDTKAYDVKVDKENNAIVRAQKVEIKDDDGRIEEIELYCHSKPREAKEDSMQIRVQTKFTQALDYLNAGFSKPRRMKKYEKVLEKVGSLKSDYASIAKYYTVTVNKDSDSDNALSITYKEKIGADDKSAMNGVYCLRTNNTTMDEQTLWKTYTTLTDLEAVFRTLKTELGLRPIFHKTSTRVDAHLFITLFAYTLIHTIRYKLKAKNITYSWSTIRAITENQIRTTITAKCEDGKILYLRKSSLLNEKQKEIFDALTLNHKAGVTTKIYK